MTELWKVKWPEIAGGNLTRADCPDCQGRGVVTESTFAFGDNGEMEPAEQEVPCSCVTRPAGLLERANLPFSGPLYQATLADLDWGQFKPDLAGKVRGYAGQLMDYVSKGLGLTLIGNVGTGKTHIAAGLVALACGLGIEARFISVGELLARLRASYDDDRRNGQPSEGNILAEFGSVPFLALDDLGTEKPSGWVRDRFYLVVNRRYMAGLTTIVTSNVGPDRLEENLGQRVISRIWGTSIALKFEGGDYRERRKAALLAELS